MDLKNAYKDEATHPGAVFTVPNDFNLHHLFILYGNDGKTYGIIVVSVSNNTLNEIDLYNKWSEWGGGKITINGLKITISTSFGGFVKYYTF